MSTIKSLSMLFQFGTLTNPGIKLTGIRPVTAAMLNQSAYVGQGSPLQRSKCDQHETRGIIREAATDDIPALVEINRKWQRTRLGSSLNDGFLSFEFGEAIFTRVIQNCDIVVLSGNNGINGYYMVNYCFHCSQNTRSALYYEKIDELRSHGIIGHSSRVAVGAQLIIDKDYQGKGYRERLLAALLSLVGEKYDLLFSTIAKDNLKSLYLNIPDGWKIVEEGDDIYYVVFDIRQRVAMYGRPPA